MQDVYKVLRQQQKPLLEDETEKDIKSVPLSGHISIHLSNVALKSCSLVNRKTEARVICLKNIDCSYGR